MMASLLKMQGDDGLWRQLLDHPEAWPETSGTGMFAFAMVTGVQHGWLDEALTAGARKAWLGLLKYIDAAGNISNVCAGTNKGTSVQYYLDRPRNTGDLHARRRSCGRRRRCCDREKAASGARWRAGRRQAVLSAPGRSLPARSAGRRRRPRRCSAAAS